MKLPTKSYSREINEMEVMRTGKWNGDVYTDDDFDEMIRAFDDLGWSVPLKLGHADAQKLMGQDDGSPALGWIDKLYRKGGKLLADLKGVPEAIYSMLQRGAYRGRSAEVYWNLKTPGGKTFKKALKAVALLGADIPAVKGLDDLNILTLNEKPMGTVSNTWEPASTTSWSVAYPTDHATIRYYNFNVEGTSMKDDIDEIIKEKNEEIKLLKEKNEEIVEASKALTESEVALKEELKTLTITVGEKDKTITELTEKMDTMRKEGVEKNFDTTFASLLAEEKVIPAWKEPLKAIYMSHEAVVSYGEEDIPARKLLMDMLEKNPKIIDLSQRATSGENDSTGDNSEEWEGKHPGMFVNMKAREIMGVNDSQGKPLTYSEAKEKVFEQYPGLEDAFRRGTIAPGGTAHAK